MAVYIQTSFTDVSAAQSELLIALLSQAGMEGFEEGDNELKAFVPASEFSEQRVREIAGDLGLKFSITEIAETNWNQLWESNFEPVTVDDFVAVRAHFHPPSEGVMHEIVITPKMSFGTGHHATTFMMMQQMRELDFKNKTVFDFGTGTGVLAILALKLGAQKVLAIDIDEWSIENAKENTARNQAGAIEILQADNANMGQVFDHILANINKHIILENMDILARQLQPGGTLLLSGLLAADEPDIVEAAGRAGLKLGKKSEQRNWLCLSMSY